MKAGAPVYNHSAVIINRAGKEIPINISEKNLIRDTLKAQGGNRLRTARQFGLSRSTLWRKIRKHGLSRAS
ncbi:MAG: helix-turn-helix domain-containing protein [Syntrophales bacterium]